MALQGPQSWLLALLRQNWWQPLNRSSLLIPHLGWGQLFDPRFSIN